MKASIIIGGIVGIALGVIATLLLAHGLLGGRPEVKSQSQLPSAPAPQIEHTVRRAGVLPLAPHRPSRPGSAPLSSRAQS